MLLSTGHGRVTRTAKGSASLYNDLSPVIENVIQIIPGFHRSIVAFASQGTPVIVDHVFQEEAWLPDFRQAAAGVEVSYVGVVCPIEILEKRE